MRYHRACGAAIEALDVVVVDDAKPMQSIIRSVLLAARCARVRCFDSAEVALQSMLVDPPTLVIVDWFMKPTDGLTLVRTMRQVRMGPLALVPAIMITAHPTRRLLEAAVGIGIHYVIAKPLAPVTLLQRLKALIEDKRRFVVDKHAQFYCLEGQDEVLLAQRERWAKIYGGHSLDPVAALSEQKRPRLRIQEPKKAVPGLGVTPRPSLPETTAPQAEAVPEAAKPTKLRNRGLGGRNNGANPWSTGQTPGRTA